MIPTAAAQQPGATPAATWCLRLGVLLPALLYVLRVAAPDYLAWPFPSHSFLRQAFAVAIGLGLCLWVQARPGAVLRGLGRVEACWGKRRALLYLTAIPLGGLMLYAAHFHQTFDDILVTDGPRVLVGDGSQWAGWIDRPMLVTSEALGRWIPHWIWRGLNPLWAIDGVMALRLGSVLGGMLLIGILLRGLPGLFAGFPFPAAFAVLFCSPLLIFFCGYPEHTPLAYAWCMGYLLAALHWLRGSRARPPWLASVLLMLATATHGATFFIYPGHLLLVFQFRRGEKPAMRQTELLQLAALTIPFVLFGAFLLWAILSPRMTGESMFWFSMIAGGADRDKFVNLWKADLHSQDTLFGARHLFHLFHLFLTMGPFLFILRRIARDLAARRDELQFLLA